MENLTDVTDYQADFSLFTYLSYMFAYMKVILKAGNIIWDVLGNSCVTCYFVKMLI